MCSQQNTTIFLIFKYLHWENQICLSCDETLGSPEAVIFVKLQKVFKIFFHLSKQWCCSGKHIVLYILHHFTNIIIFHLWPIWKNFGYFDDKSWCNIANKVSVERFVGKAKVAVVHRTPWLWLHHLLSIWWNGCKHYCDNFDILFKFFCLLFSM